MPPKKKVRKKDPKQKRVDEMLKPNSPTTDRCAAEDYDFDIPKGVENIDFPVGFRLFYVNTNIKDIVIEEIKYHKPDTYETYLDVKRIVKMATKFYKRYYTLETNRLSKPLNELTINEDCPADIRERITSFPYKDTQNNALKHKESVKIVDETNPIESRIQNFPVTLKTFKKSTFWREIVDVILKYYTEDDEAKLEAYQQNDEMCDKVIRNYYYNFYARPKIRTHFHIRLKPLPSHIKDKMLYTPTLHELKGGEKQSPRKSDGNASCSRGAVAETDGEATSEESSHVAAPEKTRQQLRRSKEAAASTETKADGRKSIENAAPEKPDRKPRRSRTSMGPTESSRKSLREGISSQTRRISLRSNENCTGNQRKDIEEVAGHVSSEPPKALPPNISTPISELEAEKVNDNGVEVVKTRSAETPGDNRVRLRSDSFPPHVPVKEPQIGPQSESKGHQKVHIQQVEVILPPPGKFAKPHEPVKAPNRAVDVPLSDELPRCTNPSPQLRRTEIPSGQRLMDSNEFQQPALSNRTEWLEQQTNYIVLDKSIILQWESEQKENIENCPEIWDSILTIENPPESSEKWPYLFNLKEATNIGEGTESKNESIAESPASLESKNSNKNKIHVKLPLLRPHPRNNRLESVPNTEVVCDDTIQRNTQNVPIAEPSPPQLTNSDNNSPAQSLIATSRRSVKRKSESNQNSIDNAKMVKAPGRLSQLDEVIKEAVNYLKQTEGATYETEPDAIQESQNVLDSESPCLYNNTVDTATSTPTQTPPAAVSDTQVASGGEQHFVTLPNTQQQLEALSTECASTQDPLTGSYIDVDDKRLLLDIAAPQLLPTAETDLGNNTTTVIKQEKGLLKNVKFIYDDNRDAFECIPIRESEQIVSILDDDSNSDINLTAELMKMPSALSNL